MYIVTFEAWPDPQYQATYLEHAGKMRDEVEKIMGFVSVERFQSLYDEGKLLSVSVWESEEAIRNWKQHTEHQMEQALGKSTYFRAYRIRISKVIKDYSYKNPQGND